MTASDSKQEDYRTSRNSSIIMKDNLDVHNETSKSKKRTTLQHKKMSNFGTKEQNKSKSVLNMKVETPFTVLLILRNHLNFQ